MLLSIWNGDLGAIQLTASHNKAVNRKLYIFLITVQIHNYFTESMHTSLALISQKEDTQHFSLIVALLHMHIQ